MFKIFGKHYGTERFFIMLFSCFVVMAGLMAYGKRIAAENNRQTVASTALYTPEYTWSRTGARGSVVGLARNSDGTRVFMLIRNTGNASDIDANEYQAFMKAADSKLANNPAMTIYSFGNTGYIGFYFTDSRGFANQVLSIIVRNNSVASDMATANVMDSNVERDQSFIDNNQIRLYVNFGASEMPVLDVLDEKPFSPVRVFTDMAAEITDGTNVSDVYRSMTAYGAESSSGGTMQAKLASMYDDMNNIRQISSNLTQQGVRVPDLPYYIKDDAINTTPNDFTKEPVIFDTSMFAGAATGSSGTSFLHYDDEEEDMADADTTAEDVTSMGAMYDSGDEGKKPYYYLHTDYLYPGTVNLEWQGKPFSSGFINQLDFYKDDPETSMYAAYGEYASWRDRHRSSDEENAEMPSYIKYTSWRMADGEYVDRTSQNDYIGVNDMITRYESAVNSYMQHKKEYLTMFDELLSNESKIQILADKAIITNASEDNLLLYGDR